MNDIAFVDTNILVYAHDRTSGNKRHLAARLIEQLWQQRTGRLSVQVLQEFYVTATQKLSTPLARAGAREVVRTYAPWVHAPTTPENILRAAELAELAQLSFWDALIVTAAEQVGAKILYSEDMNSDQVIAGVRIINPLL